MEKPDANEKAGVKPETIVVKPSEAVVPEAAKTPQPAPPDAATAKPVEAAKESKPEPPTQSARDPDAKPEPAAAIEPPPAKAEASPDATPQPTRARAETIAMPAQVAVGTPPAVPPAAAPRPSGVDELAFMPGPRDIPGGNPADAAPPPGRVPSGDSRSLRKGNEFALVYRVQTCVISRFGVVGTRGQWRVVEYPTSSAAGNSYAKECSRFVSEGFSDYRE